MLLQPGPHDVANVLFGKKGSKHGGKPRHSKGSGHNGSSSGNGAAAATGAAAAKAAEVTQQTGQCPLRKFPGAKVCSFPVHSKLHLDRQHRHLTFDLSAIESPANLHVTSVAQIV